MKKFISEGLAIYGILTILSLVVIFHFLVLFGVIPYDIVWGGRMTTKAEMLQFETLSIIINLIMLTVVAIRAGLIRANISARFLRIAFWIMFTLFTLNTVGNLVAENNLEKIIFTPLTFILAVFCLRLAVERD